MINVEIFFPFWSAVIVQRANIMDLNHHLFYFCSTFFDLLRNYNFPRTWFCHNMAIIYKFFIVVGDTVCCLGSRLPEVVFDVQVTCERNLYFYAFAFFSFSVPNECHFGKNFRQCRHCWPELSDSRTALLFRPVC